MSPDIDLELIYIKNLHINVIAFLKKLFNISIFPSVSILSHDFLKVMFCRPTVYFLGLHLNAF